MNAVKFDTIELDVVGAVATITLNRPHRLNAYVPAMKDELLRAFDVTDSDDAVRAVIVTGAGSAFCAGADLENDDIFDVADVCAPGDVVPDAGGEIALRVYDSLKPVIAAINGPAVGLGASLCLPMDFRLASETARFGFVFTRRGIVPESCSSWFLPRLVGISTALEWSLGGELFLAEEAHRHGLVRSVHAKEDLLPAAFALAEAIAARSAPVSVALTRQMMWKNMAEPDPRIAHRVESALLQSRGASKDAREGVNSFLEVRAAEFPDRVSANLPGYFPWWADMGAAAE
ncbi:enoyl-CoA hydratase-related protein [Sphingopyxis kveilinensis]|uniref:enoyl-CoA hydratase-related protein n=1 Tax=Sphingopyxis kveilinensis TaxID=3114367 RepID=UPI0030CE6D1C